MDHPREHHGRNDTPAEEAEILRLLDGVLHEQAGGTLDARTLRLADRRIRSLLRQMRGLSERLFYGGTGTQAPSPLLLPTGLPPPIDARLTRHERMVMNIFLKQPGRALSANTLRQELEAEDPAFAALGFPERRRRVIRAVAALRGILRSGGMGYRLVRRTTGDPVLDADLAFHALETSTAAAAPVPVGT